MRYNSCYLEWFGAQSVRHVLDELFGRWKLPKRNVVTENDLIVHLGVNGPTNGTMSQAMRLRVNSKCFLLSHHIFQCDIDLPYKLNPFGALVIRLQQSLTILQSD